MTVKVINIKRLINGLQKEHDKGIRAVSLRYLEDQYFDKLGVTGIGDPDVEIDDED